MDREVEGVCDPDCAVCPARKETLPEKKTFPTLLIVIGVIALVLVILVLAFLFGRRKKR